ncbi:hypothetical protein Trydic_g12534 [Trypoxylus dichotomus]
MIGTISSILPARKRKTSNGTPSSPFIHVRRKILATVEPEKQLRHTRTPTTANDKHRETAAVVDKGITYNKTARGGEHTRTHTDSTDTNRTERITR